MFVVLLVKISIFLEYFLKGQSSFQKEINDSDICCTLLPSNKKWNQYFIVKSRVFMFVQGEGCLLTFTLYHSHPGIWYMNRFFLTHFLTCTFISMSTSISKGCHGHVCWGKPDTTGYGNGSTDLPGTYYSSDAPLHCPVSNILTPSTLHPSYNVHVLGHTWFNLFLFVLCTL